MIHSSTTKNSTQSPIPGSRDTRAFDTLALRALLDKMSDAWERGDGDAFLSVFSDDADYVVFDGTHLHGKDDIAAAHAPLWNNVLKGSRLISTGVTIRFLTPDIALLHSRGGVQKWYQRKPSKRALSMQTMVAMRRDGNWELTAFQNTRYQPFVKSLLGKILLRIANKPQLDPTAN
jgi:uncharacterized protein (TIGR02246 family)